jgi:superfamily II DNA or RNA helicase
MNLPSLRPYQEKAIALTRQAYAAGHRKILIFLATGGGKSVIFIHLVHSLLSRGGSVVFIVKRKQLIHQAKGHFNRNGIDCSVIMSTEKGFDITKKLQVCSIDTIARREPSLLENFDFVVFVK